MEISPEDPKFNVSDIFDADARDSCHYLFAPPEMETQRSLLRKKYCKCLADIRKYADSSKVLEALTKLFGQVDHLISLNFRHAIRLLMDATVYYVKNAPVELKAVRKLEQILAEKWAGLIDLFDQPSLQGQVETLRKETLGFLNSIVRHYFHFFGT